MADLSFLNGLYGIRTPQDYGAQQPDEQSSLEAQVLALINSLEPSAQPIAPSQPQQPSMGQRVFGGIGDALTSMASVRAGGGPIATGPFAARQQAQQKSYEEQLLDYQRRQEENAAADRTLRNTVRIGASQEAMRAKREKEVASIRRSSQRPFKSEFTRDVNGETRRFRQFVDTSGAVIPVVDPKTGELVDELDLGPVGYAPSIIPGIDDEGAGILRIDKTTGKSTRVTTNVGGRVEPQPPTGFIEDMGGEAGTLAGIPAVMQAFREAEQSVGGSEGTLRKIKNWVQAKGAATSAGSIVAPEELVNYYRSMRSILFPYIKSISGAAFPEQELQRYESQFPIPGVDPPDVAENSWNVLIQQMARDMAAKYKAAGRANPNAGGGNDPINSGSETPEQKKARIRAKYGLGNP